MNRLFLFIKLIYIPLLFIIFEAVAINYYAHSTSYTRAKMLGASNSIAGGIYKQFSSIKDYFSLRKENNLLVEKITELENELEQYKALNPAPEEPPALYPTGEAAKYIYTSANVINNTIALQDNFITIDKGRLDGIEPNMAVITPEGTIVGIVQACSDKYSVCMSILNKDFRTAGRLKGSDDFGSVYWDCSSENMVQLTEVSKYATITPGDTVVTDYSSIFPPNIMIGTVQSAEMNIESYYDIEVELFTPLRSIHKVLLVRYADQLERMMLEAEVQAENNNENQPQ